ncbi:putative membrane protein [[Clostridium] bifermentans ATCC 638]|uniref:Putative membrane protein n=1 Tax=Paraclostridium bifermentans ATCC 638 = DSM 14991 TaxID=1233171 RepID=T4VPZ0_PARBF|nr:sensor histidine kinase [Paraclostridium bifermentans]EQK43175.1 putative membrane protein [[Clostridium] bifermentans ATCC 638] [Paraclostridium bifermentans ATCC 638 = DSM 14991]RIZ60401.1 GHKL domain-containing protein [Paraclostridium bifermentans]UAG17043.1 GHKL domain-containing protein [Paraclostridium bifermentans]
MLNFTQELLLILSIFIRFFILKGILTYKKEGKENEKIVFYILLLLIYIIARFYNIDQISGNNSNNLIDAILFIVFGIYYNYFYKIGYVKYILLFCLFNVYYDLIKNYLLERVLFFIITGSVISSEGALLVSNFERLKVDISINLVILFTYNTIRFLNRRLQLFDSEKRNYIYLLFALSVNSISIVGNYIFYKFEKFGKLYSEKYVFDFLLTPKLILASSIVLILLFRQILKENKLKTQNELMQNKLDMQYKYYLSIQESHMKVKKLYHDINNHICCIDNLKNNSLEVDEYISNLNDEIKEFKFIYNTGNMILDIIINEKSKLCTNKGINFTCDINFSKVNFIKPIDVSSIFDNILDNAIEACDKISDEKIDKYIRIKGTVIKSFFIIKCENSKVNSVKIYKDILLTDKIDKFMHGIGIQSIKSSLEKYNGEILFEDEKNKFMINIYIPLNQNTDS